MSVTTKGLISSTITKAQITEFVAKHKTITHIDENRVCFDGENGVRTLWTFFTYQEDVDNGNYPFMGITISTSANDEGQDIVKKIVSHFGGYYLPNDCASVPVWEPINNDKFDLFLTVKDKLRYDLSCLVGYGKVESVLEILGKYGIKLPE